MKFKSLHCIIKEKREKKPVTWKLKNTAKNMEPKILNNEIQFYIHATFPLVSNLQIYIEI